jgi:hypothetical protein
MNEKLHIGGVDADDQHCLRCGSNALDTGWECNDCGYDNRPHYYRPVGHVTAPEGDGGGE